jgi:carboxypeptidase C (cathepsin A)
MTRLRAIMVALWGMAAAGVSMAAPPGERPAPGVEVQKGSSELPLPPAGVTIRQTVGVASGALSYSVTAASLVLRDATHRRMADIAYTAYALDPGKHGSVERHRRPVTFVFNGGPGAASAYLHLGLIGPKGIEFANPGNGPSDAVVLRDQPYHWLEFTDLVFVDPPGTGFSRVAVDDVAVRKQFFGVEQDVEQLSRFVALWLAQAGRASSPKYLVGESYAGIRVAKMAAQLQKVEGVGVSGLVLLSPVLDDVMIASPDISPLPWVTWLPSLAAAHLEAQGRFTEAAIDAVEQYARTDFLRDLMLGVRDPQAIERLTSRVADLTGLDQALVRHLGGRIDPSVFTREMRREEQLFVSAYDTAVTSHDPYPRSAQKRGDDPILMGSIAPLASAMTDLTRRIIGWQIDRSYKVLNLDVKKAWDYGKAGGDPLQSVDELRRAMSLDSQLRVLVAHGYTDIRTPYFASRLIIEQIPPMGAAGRLRLEIYPGGHMFYSRAGSAARFRADVRALYEAREH